jgi:hypothetical protein
MAKLKPIGSEKLEGTDKLKRIMEIATYKVGPSSINEGQSDYSINLADGASYHIVKEKLGYIIKKGINESQADYIEPMKNRKYYSSYGQALKRLNLLVKEVNSLHDVTEETSLFGEQKKFVLKTPKAAPAPAPEAPAVPSEPAPLPEPALPGSEMGDEEGPLSMDDFPLDGEDLDAEVDMDVEGGESPAEDMEEKVSFKLIQKLTGKLTQKVRALENKEGMSSEDIKYVINMVLSSLDLTKLEPEDMEDVMSKFEDVEADEEMNMDMDSDMEEPTDVDMEMDVEMGEPAESAGHIFDELFKESKVDKVLSKYFEVSETEKNHLEKLQEERNEKKLQLVKESMSKVENLSVSESQKLAGVKFLEENTNFNFIGRTNKGNLVFENKDKQVKVSPEGLVL